MRKIDSILAITGGKDLTQDSRGLPLSANDLVIYTKANSIHKAIIAGMKESEVGLRPYDIRHLRTLELQDAFVFNISDVWEDWKLNYITICVGANDRVFNLPEANSFQNIGEINELREKEWRIINSNGGTMPIFEWFGRPFQVGTFGIVEDGKSKAYKYGIIISSTHMFLETGFKVRIKNFFMLDKLTEQEEQLKRALINKYNAMTQKSVRPDYKVQIGDVYYATNTFYIKLGRIALGSKCVVPCNVLCNISFYTEGPVWLRVKVKGKNIEEQFKYIRSRTIPMLLYACMGETIETVTEQYKVNCDLILDYKKVVGFKCFESKDLKSPTYIGHLDLTKLYKIDNKLGFDFFDIFRTHVFDLNLLDL